MNVVVSHNSFPVVHEKPLCDLVINRDRFDRHRNRWESWNGVAGEDGVQRIHRPRALLSVKEHQVLYRLLPLTKHVDDILCKLTAQECCNWRKLASQVLQEAAEELSRKRARREHVQLVLLRGHHSKHLQLLWIVRRENTMCQELILPQRAHAGEQRVYFLQPAMVA